jgi:magnesium-transporting ATPase (P-type)
MDLGVELARTTGFPGIVVFEKVSVFAFGSLRLPSWEIGLFSNSFLLLALTVTFGTQVLAHRLAALANAFTHRPDVARRMGFDCHIHASYPCGPRSIKGFRARASTHVIICDKACEIRDQHKD